MANAYTQLGFVKQADGENIGSWGDVLNEQLIDLLDDAIGGYVEVSVASGNVTLAFADGTADNNGRHAVIKFTGSPGTTRTITFPNKQKTYYINNGSDSSVICTAGSGGATVTIPTSKKTIIYVDGSDEVHDMFSSPSLSDSSVTNAMLAGSIADSKLSTISTAGKVDIGALEIDGATDIGADLADADLIIVDDGAGGTERKAAMSRVATYVQGGISGDITISSGTAAIGSGVIVNADINSSAAIAMSKTAFSAGTGVTLSTNTLNVDAAQTGITSITNTSLVVGRDADNDIDFATDNNIIFRAAGADQIVLKDGVLEPVTDDDVALGTTGSKRFTNLFLSGQIDAAGAANIGGNLNTNGVFEIDVASGDPTIIFDTQGADKFHIAVDDSDSDNLVIKSGGTVGSGNGLKLDSSGNLTVTGEVQMTTLDIGGTNVTSTAAELNILDGVTATATELNIMDGDTSATSTTLADADRLVTNDAGTMKQVALTDLKTYLTSAGFSSEDPTALAIALG
jgi:hypothetical protein